MKKLFITLLMPLVAASAFAAQAQPADSTSEKPFPLFCEIEAGGTSRHHTMHNLLGDVSLGARFGRMEVAAVYEHLTGIYKADGDKRSLESHAIGGAVACQLATIKESSLDGEDSGLALRARFIHSVGNADWTYSAYEGAAILSNAIVKNINVAVGYRYTKSHTAGLPDHSGFFGSFGFRF